jgi:cyclophilin family peptidyl-prolyl cis-trans isomerase
LGFGFLACALSATAATNYVRFDTNLGSFDVELLPADAPHTVANFLYYVNNGSYNSTIIDRSVPGFVIQGGTYGTPFGFINEITPSGPVVNEFKVSNTRGTLALAKAGSNPDSGTTAFFFNEVDNSANLDHQNGGFTVFGKVANNFGLSVMDSIGAQTIPSPDPLEEALGNPVDGNGQPLVSDTPVIGYDSTSGNFTNYVLVGDMVPESAPTAPTITSVTPSAGKVGDKIVIKGTNFAGLEGVSVNGVGAAGTYNPTAITVTVPSGATSGQIIVSSGNGGIYAPLPFTVLSAEPTAAKLTLSNLTGTYTAGVQHAVTVTTTPANVPNTVLYNGSATAPTDTGTYTVVATATGTATSGTGYIGSATGKLVISPAAAAISVPSSIAGHTFTDKITSAGADFPSGSSFDLILGSTSNAGILPLSSTVQGASGTAALNSSSSVTDVITFQTIGTVYAFNNYVFTYTFTTPTTGTFSISNTSSGTAVPDGAGTFTLVQGQQPPAAVAGWSFQLSANTGNEVTKGTTSLAVAADSTFQMTGADGTHSGSSTYSVPGSTQNGSTLVLTDSSNANYAQTLSLSWLTATSGVYLLQVNSTGAWQVGNFTAKPATVPPITGMLTATGTLLQSFTYTITDASPISSYTATGLPAGLTLNSATGVISGVPAAAGTFNVALTAMNGTTASAKLVLTINKAAATVTAGGLTVGYTGTAVGAAFTTSPPGLDLTYAYTQAGKTVTPIARGTYDVTATVNDDDYSGSATGTFTVTTGTATFALSKTTVTYTGKPQAPTVVTTPKGLPIILTYTTGTTTTTTNPTAVGSYPFTVTLASSEMDYVGSTTGTFTISGPFINQGVVLNATASGANFFEAVTPSGLATTAYYRFGTTTAYGLQTQMQTLGSGSAAVNVYGLISGLAPNTTYYFQLVTVSAAGTFYGPQKSFTTAGFDTTLVAESGDTDSGGLAFATLGSPARDGTSAADVAFGGTVNASGSVPANTTGIWTAASSGSPARVALVGQAAPGSGSTFATLSDPVINDAGNVAFYGTFSGGTGLWSNDSGSLALVAKSGDAAPNAGATFKTFGHAVLPEHNEDPTPGPIFVGTLNTGNGVTAANSTGIWAGEADTGLTQLLRQGQALGDETLTQFNFLPSVPLVGGQTRGFVPTTGHLAMGATFADKTTGIVTVTATGAHIAEQSGGATGMSGVTFGAFGPPAIVEGDHLAFAATLTGTGITAANSASVWADNGSGTPTLVARAGGSIGTGTAVFATLTDPVYNNNHAVAFGGTIKGATAAYAAGVWCNSTGTLSIVAQQGTYAPSAIGGTFAAFNQIALPDQGGLGNHGGVVMLATLNASTTYGITPANNTGIWAVDTTGTLQLIVRTGDLLPDRAGAFKTVASLAFLPNETVVNGQTRSFDPTSGDLVFLATFSDKTTGIYAVSFP